MKAAIAIDTWKLPIFSRLLTAAGYAYEKAGVFSGGSCMILHVYTDSMTDLADVVQAANDEAAATGGHA